MKYNKQYGQFLAKMGQVSGQASLCEAIHDAYKACCESRAAGWHFSKAHKKMAIDDIYKPSKAEDFTLHDEDVHTFDYKAFFKKSFSNKGFTRAQSAWLYINATRLYNEAIRYIDGISVDNPDALKYRYTGYNLADDIYGYIDPYGWGLRCAAEGPISEEDRIRTMSGIKDTIDEFIRQYNEGDDDMYPPMTGAAPDDEDTDYSVDPLGSDYEQPGLYLYSNPNAFDQRDDYSKHMSRLHHKSNV